MKFVKPSSDYYYAILPKYDTYISRNWVMREIMFEHM